MGKKVSKPDPPCIRGATNKVLQRVSKEDIRHAFIEWYKLSDSSELDKWNDSISGYTDFFWGLLNNKETN